MKCVFVTGFFFCKQKTAYEMRMSDWSSDVCSSVLAISVVVAGKRRAGPRDPGVLDPRLRQHPAAVMDAALPVHLAEAQECARRQRHVVAAEIDELGRAACRDRV